MIHSVSGDILMSPSRAIAHGVTPGDHFDSGLALALRERWPAMPRDFRHHCQASHPKPGDLWVWAGADGVPIVNLLTLHYFAVGHSSRCFAFVQNWVQRKPPDITRIPGARPWCT